MQSVGGLLLSLTCILFISSINKTKLMVASGLLLAGMLALVGVLPPLPLLFVIFTVLGFAGGAVNTLTNSVMVDSVPGRADRFISFMHMLFSLGAVATPLLSQSLVGPAGLSGVFLIFGGFMLCWAVYASFVFSGFMKIRMVTGAVSLKPQLRKALGILKVPGMGIIFGMSILMTAWQLSAIYYISTYFTGLTGSNMSGALALSLFFLGMMASRLLYSRVADRFSKGHVLIVTDAAALACWVALFLVPDLTAKYVFVALAAAAGANNFPVAFTAACHLAPHNTAAAAGFVNLGYFIAIFTIIPTVGALGGAAGLNFSLALCAIPLLLLIPAGALLHRRMAIGDT
jgi:MFS family permease